MTIEIMLARQESAESDRLRGVKSPKPQPKHKIKAPAAPRKESTVDLAGQVAPAFKRIPPHPKPFMECPPLNHPRGKDGGWGG